LAEAGVQLPASVISRRKRDHHRAPDQAESEPEQAASLGIPLFVWNAAVTGFFTRRTRRREKSNLSRVLLPGPEIASAHAAREA
jgi:hypothetical protein